MKKVIKLLIIALFWILIWYFVALIVNMPLLFPTPWVVIKKIGQLMLTGDYYVVVLSSIGRILSGILIAIFMAAVLALISSFSNTVYEFLTPLISVIKSTPIVAFIFIVNLYLDNEYVVIFMCFLMVFPIVFLNIYQGIKSTDKDLIEMCNLYNIPLKRRLISLYLPSVVPYFLSSLLSSIGLAWKAGIAAEVLCPPDTSIGIKIFSAQQNI